MYEEEEKIEPRLLQYKRFPLLLRAVQAHDSLTWKDMITIVNFFSILIKVFQKQKVVLVLLSCDD